MGWVVITQHTYTHNTHAHAHTHNQTRMFKRHTTSGIDKAQGKDDEQADEGGQAAGDGEGAVQDEQQLHAQLMERLFGGV